MDAAAHLRPLSVLATALGLGDDGRMTRAQLAIALAAALMVAMIFGGLMLLVQA